MIILTAGRDFTLLLGISCRYRLQSLEGPGNSGFFHTYFQYYGNVLCVGIYLFIIFIVLASVLLLFNTRRAVVTRISVLSPSDFISEVFKVSQKISNLSLHN